MRPIKFRAWDKKAKRMYWNVQDCYDMLGHHCHPDPDSDCPDQREHDIMASSFGGVLADEDYAVMQFTGLRDRHGKEIYEGDVVRYYPLQEDYDNHADISLWVQDEVVFENGTFRLKGCRQWKDGEHEWYSLENLCADDLEILGNLYANPELLEAT